MSRRIAIAVSLIFLAAGQVYALRPDEILVIANADIPASIRIAKYYCAKRKVPTGNILALPLGVGLSDSITRADYEKRLAGLIRKKISSPELAGKIRCLLTMYGVPIKVGGRGPLKDRQNELKRLEELIREEKSEIEHLKREGSIKSARQKERASRRLQSKIDRIVGKETNASVDSELSMVLFGDYELYRWQPNELINSAPYWEYKTLMVCRLDGPSEEIARGLVDKAIAAEKTGLRGAVYIDSRGIANDKKLYSRGYFDRSLRNLVVLARLRTEMPVEQERTEKLFTSGDCPRTAIYCGWYSLRKYVDAFDFVDGAIGYHISSLEAVGLRDPNSNQWCPAMLKDGVTATLGAVAEPYLHSFPLPDRFFLELFNGRCLVEAYYRTKPFNSWQL
ncbi:unnamed protein product, partial [marine sediment metagenome]